MKATLEFDLETPQDVNAHRRCSSATNAYIALFSIREELRKYRKYRELDESQTVLLEEIETFFYAELDNQNINLNDLE
jgi:hypothetical protein